MISMFKTNVVANLLPSARYKSNFQEATELYPNKTLPDFRIGSKISCLAAVLVTAKMTSQNGVRYYYFVVEIQKPGLKK